MSLFSLFCQITCKIEAFFQNEILSEKNTKEKIFIGKKGGSISCRRTVAGFVLIASYLGLREKFRFATPLWEKFSKKCTGLCVR